MSPDETERERRLVLKEVRESEERYLAVLANLAAFAEPLRHSHVLLEEVRRRMFPSTLGALRIVGQTFLKDLDRRMGQYKSVGDLFVRLANECSIVVPYALDFGSMTKLYNEQKKTNPQFRAFVEATFAKLATRDKDMTSLLVAPVQRVPRYLLLCKQLLKFSGGAEAEALRQAETLFTAVCQRIQDKATDNEHVEQLYRIQEALQGDFESLISPTRRYVAEFVLYVMHHHKSPEERILYLFNDLVVFASVARDDGKELALVYLSRLSLDCVAVADAPNHGDYWAFHLILNNEATCVGFTSQERRDEVRGKIAEQISHLQDNKRTLRRPLEDPPALFHAADQTSSEPVLVIGAGSDGKALRHRRARSDNGSLQDKPEPANRSSGSSHTHGAPPPAPQATPQTPHIESHAPSVAPSPLETSVSGRRKKSGGSRKQKETMVALRDCVPADTANLLLLSFRKGDELVIMDRSNPSGWWWGHVKGSKVGGLIRADALDLAKVTAAADLCYE
jgi:hypothetical protein